MINAAESFAGFDGFAASASSENRRKDEPIPCGDGQPWPEPRPISGTLAEVPVLDPELLPESIRGWAVDLAERFQVPVDYPAAAVIAMVAGALARRALIFPKRHDDWVVYGNMWGAIVGRSGVMKTPIINAALGPLRRRQALAMAIYESERDDYERQLAEHGTRRRRFAAARRSGGGELEFDAMVPQPPILTRHITNESSIEKLHMILKENPGGALLFRDELSGWISQLSKAGRERERSFYLETWAGNGSFIFDRVGRGTIHADNLCLSVFGGIQPSHLQAHVADLLAGGACDDGFLARFQLLVWPDVNSHWEDIDRPPDFRAERRVEDVVDRFLKLSPEDPVRTRFSPAAQELFGDWRKELELKIRRDDLPPAVESHLSKYRSLLPKLAMIFHLADDENMEPEIPLLQTQRAAEFCRYLEEHAHRVYGSAPSLPPRLAATVAQRIRNGDLGNRFTLRDVYMRGWAGIDNADRARLAITVLRDAGWVRTTPPLPGRPGRPSEEFVVNPAVLPV